MDQRRGRWAFSPYQVRPQGETKVRLKPLRGIRYNPGSLRGFYYAPDKLKEPAPLIVVLHGCTQTAEEYDKGSGWSRLADRYGFALLFPEQKEANNGGRCFNWFQMGDSQRGMGEPASIRSMLDAVRALVPIDQDRIFVTGLSAGGAMASVMLATYADVFAAGAIIAGVPFGCASDMRQAFDCMGGYTQSPEDELAAKVRRASPHKGPWPRVSIWQGSADQTVVPSNADALVRQWTQLHGLPVKPTHVGQVEGYPHKVWLDLDGRVAVERYDIIGMAHGTPLRPGDGDGESGVSGEHMLDAHISSTDHIAAFFGVAPQPPHHYPRHPVDEAQNTGSGIPYPWDFVANTKGVRQAFEDALRAGGFLK
jgi:poly(hydroxyalkanoate) depolymerase family esterase